MNYTLREFADDVADVLAILALCTLAVVILAASAQTWLN